ncbi:MAG TPA: Yip1 family protein [Candidatus Angelobacter sp.]|nr:Yip1 family protein [Candidatus Angelobacter sp.]
MIKAFLLVVDPVATWDRIVQAKRSWPVILLTYLLPLWLIAFVAEGYGLVHWGKPRGLISEIHKFSPSEALIFEIIQLGLMFLLVFLGARLVKAFGETFRGRNTFDQAFTVTAYGLAPVFTMRVFDIFPGVSNWVYWVTWVVGILLTIAILYHGIPRVMLPDPPHAFGLYLVSSVFLAMLSGLIRYVTYAYLIGKLGKLDAFISSLETHLPFLQSFNQLHF